MNVFEKWKDNIADYVDVRLNIMKLTLIERSSTAVSYLILTFIALFLALAILIFLGIGMAEGFSILINSRPGGYLITAGVFTLLTGLLFAARSIVINTFSGIFIRILTEPDAEESEAAKPQETEAQEVVVE